jgi:hypothetical protein
MTAVATNAAAAAPPPSPQLLPLLPPMMLLPPLQSLPYPRHLPCRRRHLSHNRCLPSCRRHLQHCCWCHCNRLCCRCIHCCPQLPQPPLPLLLAPPPQLSLQPPLPPPSQSLLPPPTPPSPPPPPPLQPQPLPLQLLLLPTTLLMAPLPPPWQLLPLPPPPPPLPLLLWPPSLKQPPPHSATPTSACAVAIPIHCRGHHCGVVVVGLCCHCFFLQSPETASVEELCTYFNVGIFLKVLQASVFFKFCQKRIKLFSQFKLFLSNLVIQIVSHKSASVCCLVIHHTL